MEYKFLTNLQEELALPEKGILSHVLQKDDYVNVTLFGFAAGEELSSHSAPTPAILYFLEGEGMSCWVRIRWPRSRVLSSICLPCFPTAFLQKLPFACC